MEEKLKILICGLPGSGKTTLAEKLSKEYQCVWFNGDEIRQKINKHLSFSKEDRILQAETMGILCDIVLKSQGVVIADFVCPTKETRKAFGPYITVFMNTIDRGRFEDTNQLFEPPEDADVIVNSFEEANVNSVFMKIFNLPKRKTVKTIDV